MSGSTNIGRRSVLAALAVAPVVSCGPSPAVAQSSTLQVLIAVADAANERATKFYNEVFEPAEFACVAAVKAIPHHETVNSYVNVHHERITLSTASVPSVAMARASLKRHSKLSGITEEWLATNREVVAAADRRSAEAERLKAEHRIDEMKAEDDLLISIACEAENAVFAHPAADLADVLLKVEYAERTSNTAGEHVWEGIAADVRRLAGEVRS